MFCGDCGYSNEPSAAFCGRCGSPLTEEASASPPPSPPASAVLEPDNSIVAERIAEYEPAPRPPATEFHDEDAMRRPRRWLVPVVAASLLALGAASFVVISASRKKDDENLQASASSTRTTRARATTTLTTLRSVTMPSVVGLQLETAVRILNGLGVQVDTAPRESIQPEGTVIEQTPATGTENPSRATLVVATKGARLSNASKLRLNGFGGVAVGMTRGDAETAAGRRFTEGAGTEGCVEWAVEGLAGVSVMTWDDKVVRINISQTPYTTQSGIGVGSTESDVYAKYPGQIRTQQHTYDENGHYLEYIPKDANQQQFSLLFETDGARVTQFRAGNKDAVELVEGCF
ncbi:MAG: hypothetical protein QOK28_913 [Actinomycetota bacterium]|jgi:hypothetical protein